NSTSLSRSANGYCQTDSLRQVDQVMPGGSAIGGRGAVSMSVEIPVTLSVKHRKRVGRVVCRRTIEARRLTYSGPYRVPHFIQMTVCCTLPLAIARPCCLPAQGAGRNPVASLCGTRSVLQPMRAQTL